MAQILAPAPEALSNEEIILRYKTCTDEIIKAATDPTYDFERCCLLAQAKYNWILRGFRESSARVGQ